MKKKTKIFYLVGNRLIVVPLLILFIASVSLLIYIYIPPDKPHISSQLFVSDFAVCNVASTKINKDSELIVWPKVSNQDDKVNINVKGLAPFQIGTLKLSVTDSEGANWESAACFQANQQGEIILQNQAPLDGSTYSGVHTMGLFWSLKPEKLRSFNYRTDLKYIISFETDESVILSDIIIRKSCLNLENQDINKEEIRDKIVGNLYLHNEQIKRATVILLAGSGGNFQHQKASYLASKGYNVLDLKYFGADGLPEKLEEVSLEYLKNSIDWLKKQPTVDSSKIALMGRSKGAEYALLYASKYNNIHALISVVGSNVTWSSKNYFKSSWTHNGIAIPYVKGSYIEAIKYLKKSNGTAQNQLPYMLSAFKNEERINKSTIKVEAIKCPILLISGEDDLQWPSSMMSRQILVRAKKNPFQYAINHYSYQEAGHQFDELPYIPQVDFSSIKTWRSGGNFQGNALASIDSWKKTLSFLEKHLTNSK